MSTITRQKLVDNVKARMATIWKANGYYTDAGSKINEWRVTPLGNNELGNVSVRDPDDVPVQGSLQGGDTLIDRWLTVVITWPFAGGPSDAAETMRKGLTDVYKAIGTETDGFRGETWGGIATLTEDLGNTVVVAQEDQRVIGIDITIRIQYRTTKWNES